MDMELVHAHLRWWNKLRKDFGDPRDQDIDAAILGAICQGAEDHCLDCEVSESYLRSLNL